MGNDLREFSLIRSAQGGMKLRDTLSERAVRNKDARSKAFLKLKRNSETKGLQLNSYPKRATATAFLNI